MLDFIKNNKMIAAAVVVLFFLIIAIVAMFLISNNSNPSEEVDPEQNQVFGNIDGEREFASSSQGIFANPGEQWVGGEDGGGTVPLLRAITKVPVAGATVFERSVGGENVEYVRFTGLTDGHLFEAPIASVSMEKKIANDTIVRIGESIWNKKGSAVATRYFDEDGIVVRSRLGYFVSGTSTENTLEGEAAPEHYETRDLVGNITDISFSPDGKRVFYLVKTLEGSAGYVESLQTGNSTQVWSSILSSLKSSWEADNTILIYTKPTSVAEGVVWTLDPGTGKEKFLFGKEYALGAKMSPDGKKVLYSVQETENKLFTLKIFDVATKKTISLPLATMIEKCAWGPSKYIYCAVPNKKNSGGYLEQWYMGTESSEDVLWRIDTEAGVVKKLVDPYEEIEQKLDIVNIAVSPQETYLIFKSRGNSVLWGLKLPEKVVPQEEGEESDVVAE